MSGPAHRLQRLWPRVPASVRDAYVLAQYERLAGQVPHLYGALILIVFAATYGASEHVSPLVRYGLPLVVGGVFAARLVVWLRRPRSAPSAEAARRLVSHSRAISTGVGAVCSFWCVYSWISAPTVAIYFALYMAMGAFATIACVSCSRSAVLGHLVTGVMPIAAALVISGDPMSMAAGFAIATTGGFLLVLVSQQHEKTIELLLLQRKMRRLADTDPLTGLINRRALKERLDGAIATAEPGCGPTLMLLDLDGFKPVNDRHGHGAGDEVLCEVARRLREIAEGDAEVCRVGGDEFAVLLMPGSSRSAEAMSIALLAWLARPYPVGGLTLRVGASLGAATWPRDGATLDELFRHADAALYAAKTRRDAPVSRFGTRG